MLVELLDPEDGLHATLLVLNVLLVSLNVGIVRVELCHELLVALLLGVQLLFALDKVHLSQLSRL